MPFSLFDSKGVDVDNQRFTWRDMVQKPISKLDDDAFTRVRVILINGLEVEALRFGHMAARCNRELRLPLAKVRRSEQHQATMVNWLLGADHSPLETTIAYAGRHRGDRGHRPARTGPLPGAGVPFRPA